VAVVFASLTTFSGKIDIAHAFSVIGSEMYSDLRAIKDIRDRLAHSKNVIRFDSLAIAPLLQKLSGWTAKAKRMELFMERCITRAAEFEPHEPR
jgi:DNA-binding MltR family transcriptional regulator